MYGHTLRGYECIRKEMRKAIAVDLTGDNCACQTEAAGTAVPEQVEMGRAVIERDIQRTVPVQIDKFGNTREKGRTGSEVTSPIIKPDGGGIHSSRQQQ